MLAPATNNTSFLATYDRSGRVPSHLRSEPLQRIALVPDVNSTTTENPKDKVTLSEGGIAKSRQRDATEPEEASTATAAETDAEERAGGQRTGAQELTVAEEKITRQLQDRDREVKTHEMAHLASPGQYARGGPTYSYQQGPDGRRYAVGGEVPIDVSQEKTPEETIQKMQAVKRAALAPAEPSSADRSIAASATALESQARQELQSEQANPAQGQTEHQYTSENNNEVPEQTNEKAAAVPRRSPALRIVA